MPRLTAIDPATTDNELKELLGAVQAKLGKTPNVIRTMANAPAVLKAYLAQSDALSRGSFDAKSREAIALTVAGANKCEYCASAHAAISKNLKVDASEISQRIGGHASDRKLDAALGFAKKLVEKRGLVSDEDIAAVRSAGHDDGAITEIVAHVTANIFTNYLNHVASTDIDFPIVELASDRAA